MSANGTENLEASIDLHYDYAPSFSEEACEVNQAHWEEIAEEIERISAIMRYSTKRCRLLPLSFRHNGRYFLWFDTEGKDLVSGEDIRKIVPEEIAKLALEIITEEEGIRIMTDIPNLITPDQDTDVVTTDDNGIKRRFHKVGDTLIEKSRSTRQAILKCLFAQHIIINDARSALGIKKEEDEEDK
jgi:hypothetical protein